jgi:flagellar basal body-associated protein FliL
MSKKMKIALIAIVAIIILGVCAWFFYFKPKAEEKAAKAAENMANAGTSNSGTGTPGTGKPKVTA